MKVKDIYAFLDAQFPLQLREEWDNDGIMCLPENKEVKRILLCLDVTPKVAAYAKDNGFDLIISHHPMIFSPLKGITDTKHIDLIRSGISVFSFHTRMDTAEGGVNDTLASLLELKEVESFCEMARVGVLDKEMPFEDFLAYVKEKLCADTLNYVQGNKSVKKVALLGGGGKDFWQDAMNTGADVYITGEMSYNTMLDAAECGFAVIEAGHFHTEFPVLEALKKLILEKAQDVCVQILRDCPIRTF